MKKFQFSSNGSQSSKLWEKVFISEPCLLLAIISSSASPPSFIVWTARSSWAWTSESSFSSWALDFWGLPEKEGMCVLGIERVFECFGALLFKDFKLKRDIPYEPSCLKKPAPWVDLSGPWLPTLLILILFEINVSCFSWKMRSYFFSFCSDIDALKLFVLRPFVHYELFPRI